jgi:hypothetical protein
MKILMVGARVNQMMDDVRSGLNPKVVRRASMDRGVFELSDGSENGLTILRS